MLENVRICYKNSPEFYMKMPLLEPVVKKHVRITGPRYTLRFQPKLKPKRAEGGYPQAPGNAPQGG